MEPEAKSKKSNKKLFIIIGAVLVAAIIGVAVFLFIKNSNDDTIGDGYFKTNGRRLVYSVEVEKSDTNYGAVKLHQVYKIDGESVTDYTMFYEFKDEYSASKAQQTIKASAWNDDSIKSVDLYGKYVGVVFDEELYEDLTASDVRSDIAEREAYNEMMKNLKQEEQEEEQQEEE